MAIDNGCKDRINILMVLSNSYSQPIETQSSRGCKDSFVSRHPGYCQIFQRRLFAYSLHDDRGGVNTIEFRETNHTEEADISTQLPQTRAILTGE